MQQVIAIAVLQTRLILKQRGMLVLMCAMPLLLVAAFAFFGNAQSSAKPVPITVVDEDNSFASHALVTALQTEPAITLYKGDVKELLANHKIVVGLVIPSGFAEHLNTQTQPEIQVLTAPDSGAQAATLPVLTQTAANVAADYRTAMRLSRNGSTPAELALSYAQVIQARQDRQIGLIQTNEPSYAPAQLRDRAMGFTVMFVLMTVLMLNGGILQERQAGIWGRIMTTPVASGSVLWGYLLSYWLIGALQFGVLVSVSALLFHVDWGPILPLTAVGLASVLCATGIGLCLASFVRTADQQRLFGLSFAIISSMLGGVYWPLDLLGAPMRMLGHLTPQAWALDGLHAALLPM
ncbi:MAG TPA: ABC transporter permease, partial [Symbiobacteriaceae bacterium]|nr:ABC transporter permease [Symbiobacteriaceae bacterium]